MPEIPIAPIPGFYEPFSSLSHLLAGVACLILGIVSIVRNRGDALRTSGLSVFVFGVVCLLFTSGVYLLSPHGTAARAVLERLDHAAIFVLIAATFTPVHLIAFRGLSRWGILLLVWIAALSGLTLKTVLFEEISDGLGLLLYLGLGWFGAWSAYLLHRRYGAGHLTPVYVGALAYTVGAILEYANHPVLIPHVVGPHEVFHALVLLGIASHWHFIRWLSANSSRASIATSIAPGRQHAPDPASVVAPATACRS